MDTSKIGYQFFTTATACTGASSGAGSGLKSTTEGPLGSGAYSFLASLAGDPNYNDVSAPCEPLSVFQPGKTMGYWGNNNGVARILANGGYAANAVTLGGSPRSAVIDTQVKSLEVLPSQLNACGKIVSPKTVAIYDETASKTCALSLGLNIGTLNTLSAQTLALAYNIKLVSGFTGQAIGTIPGCTAVGPLTSASTVNQVLAYANSLIAGSAAGGSTTQAQAGALNTLLGCLNQES